MTVFQPAYRATIYASRKLDITEQTVMTPASGAVHSDQFKVSSIQGLSGYQPYMDTPRGENDVVSLPDFKVSVGEYSFTLMDKRTSTSNLERWVTAFVGDSSGSVRMVGRKAILEESLDGGTSWTPLFVGRVSKFSTNDPLFYSVSIRSTIEDLKADIFTTLPRVPYLNLQTLLPLGMYKQLGTIQATEPLSGSWSSDPFSVDGMTSYGLNGVGVIALEQSSKGRKDNFISKDLEKTVTGMHLDRNGMMFYDNCFGYLTNNSGVTGRVNVLNYMAQANRNKVDNGVKYSEATVVGIIVEPVDYFDSEYIAPAVWQDATWVKITIAGSNNLSSEESERAAFWLQDVHPVQVWKDILDGHYSPYFSGTPLKSFDYDVAKFNALIADESIPKSTFRISKAWKALDFIEEAICKPYSLGYATQVSASGGSYVSAITPFRTTIPTSIPTSSITISDIITNELPEWEASSPVAVMLTYYIDQVSTFEKQKENATKDNKTFNITSELDFPILILDATEFDAPLSLVKIDAVGIRGQVQAPVSNSVSYVAQDQATTTKRIANSLVAPYTQRYSNGTPTVRLACRRTSTINSLNIGDWTLVDIDMLPNQATHLRGGNRVMQVVGKSTNELTVSLKLIDGAINSTMAVPTINSVSSNATLVNNAVDISLTTTENARVVVQYAATVLGSSQPSAGDGGWMHGTVGVLDATTSTVYIDRLPSGATIYVRARAESVATDDVMIPSAWVYSSGVNLGALSTPTGLSISNITSKSAKISWTPTERAKIEVRLASPTDAPLNSVAMLPSGSTSYTIRGLDQLASTSCLVAVRHVDGVLGRSALVSGSFTATGTAEQLPVLGETIVYFGATV